MRRKSPQVPVELTIRLCNSATLSSKVLIRVSSRDGGDGGAEGGKGGGGEGAGGGSGGDGGGVDGGGGLYPAGGAGGNGGGGDSSKFKTPIDPPFSQT